MRKWQYPVILCKGQLLEACSAPTGYLSQLLASFNHCISLSTSEHLGQARIQGELTFTLMTPQYHLCG